MNKKAIIIGASSGIGRAIAQVLSPKGYTLGLAARRLERLQELQKELPGPTYIQFMDLKHPEAAMRQLESMIQEMNGVDLIILNAGIGFINPDLELYKEVETVEVNVLGFIALANIAMQYFEQQGAGHLVGISSISALRGNANTPAYNASKAFISNYMESMRHRAYKKKLPIFVTDIRPGFVDTEMTQGNKNMFWVATAEQAAGQIVSAIEKKKKIAYITRRWNLIAWWCRWMPDCIFYKF